MWVIEYEDYRIGGVVGYEKKYRFKHLSSGMFLAGKNKIEGDETKNFYLTFERTEETLFHFNPLKNQITSDKIIKKGSYVYICNSNNYWIDVVPLLDDNKKSNISKIQPNNPKFKTLDDENVDKYIPKLHQE